MTAEPGPDDDVIVQWDGALFTRATDDGWWHCGNGMRREWAWFMLTDSPVTLYVPAELLAAAEAEARLNEEALRLLDTKLSRTEAEFRDLQFNRLPALTSERDRAEAERAQLKRIRRTLIYRLESAELDRDRVEDERDRLAATLAERDATIARVEALLALELSGRPSYARLRDDIRAALAGDA